MGQREREEWERFSLEGLEKPYRGKLQICIFKACIRQQLHRENEQLCGSAWEKQQSGGTWEPCSWAKQEQSSTVAECPSTHLQRWWMDPLDFSFVVEKSECCAVSWCDAAPPGSVLSELIWCSLTNICLISLKSQHFLISNTLYQFKMLGLGLINPPYFYVQNFFRCQKSMNNCI